MSIRSLGLGLVSSLCVLATCASFFSKPAFAKEVHIYKSEFGSKGSEPGQFEEAHNIAVDDSTELTNPAAGDVYVVDQEGNRVERFSATGEYLGQFNGGGTYEDNEEPVKVKTGAAAPTGAFHEPGSIAVDNSGDPGIDPSASDVYVVDVRHGVVDKFSPVGVYLGQVTETPVVKKANGETTGGRFEPEGTPGVEKHILKSLAVDPKGTLWINVGRQVYKFSDGAPNQYVSEIEPSNGGDFFEFAVDAEDNFYVGSGSNVTKISSSGSTLLGLYSEPENPERYDPFGHEASTGRGSAYQQEGTAVDPVTGEVFIGRDTLAEPYEATVGAFSLDAAPIDRFGSASLKGPFPIQTTIAVNSSNGTVYVTNVGTDQVSVFEGVVLPSVSIQPVNEQTTRSVTLNGLVSPEGKPVTSCVFEYASAEEYAATKAYGHSVPCEPAPGGSTEAVPVKAEIKGLSPEAAYHYRLVADNAGGESATEDQELLVGPVLAGEAAVEVTSTSATPQLSIGPNGADTHYYLEYGPTAAYGSFAPVAPPGVDLGAATVSQAVSVHLQDLEADATYHYRFVAVQDGEVFEEPDRIFTTQGAGGALVLPDGRLWELVSPANKHGGLIQPSKEADVIQAASDGDGITYASAGPAIGENPQGEVPFGQMLSERGHGGWRTEDLTIPSRIPDNGEPPAEAFTFQGEYALFASDLSLGAIEPHPLGMPLLSPEATTRTLYLRDDSNGGFLPVVTPKDVSPSGARIEEPSFHGSQERWQMHFLAGTPDLSHVVFKSPLALTEDAVQEETDEGPRAKEGQEHQWNLYEWSGEKLQLIDVLPEGEGGEPPHGHGPEVTLAGTGNFGGAKSVGDDARAMSGDGNRIAWTWGDAYGSALKERYKGLYVRDMQEEDSVKVGGTEPIFQTMNNSGSEIFYVEKGDLYVFDDESGVSTDLTTDHAMGESSGGVQELVSDVSEDGSYVYFVATGVLANGGVSGEDNLYLLHDVGGVWATKYIATLSPEDEPSWHAKGDVDVPALSRVSSRVSPDGQWLAFMSDRELTGYDNHDAASGQPDEEVYLYDAETGRLACVSCDPTGARPIGIYDNGDDGGPLVDRLTVWANDAGEGGSNHWLAGNVPGWDEDGAAGEAASGYQPRYLSDSGRLFFNSSDGLVPQATNGLENVYEFEPPGVGSCTTGESTFSGRSGGCVSLLSSGTSSSESAFLDASENGDDVFFLTTSELVPSDHETSYSIYDAHVCSSEVPCVSERVPPPECATEASCRAAPSVQPEIFGPPPSATFSGVGNVLLPSSPATGSVKKAKKKAARCARGRKLSRGKCVKKKKSKVRARKANNAGRAR